MSRLRTLRGFTALLALLFFAGYVGAGWLHAHPADPGCQICKDLHANQADVAPATGTRATLVSLGAVALPSHDDTGNPTETTPRGRAPPQA